MALVLFNPRAGKGPVALARLLESTAEQTPPPEVVLSSEQLHASVHQRVQSRQPVMIYGGDGTLQRTLDQLFAPRGFRGHPRDPLPRLAAVGGGTMNVISRWSGFSRAPLENVRRVLQAQAEGSLVYRHVPLLRIRQGNRAHVGFIFGMGPMIRVVESFGRRAKKTRLEAVAMLAKALGSVFFPSIFTELAGAVAPLEATIEHDGTMLPFEQYGLLFASTTDQVFLGTKPFTHDRRPQEFNFAAYADSPRAISATFPLLARGWIPAERRPVGSSANPEQKDSRYVNQTSQQLTIRSPEQIYTIDGEIFESTGEPLIIETGPTVALALNPARGLQADRQRTYGLTRPPQIASPALLAR